MNLRETLREFVAEDLLSGETSVGLDDNLLADGMLDSMGAVALVAHIYETTGYQIPSEDLTIENFRTVNHLVSYLEPRISGRS